MEIAIVGSILRQYREKREGSGASSTRCAIGGGLLKKQMEKLEDPIIRSLYYIRAVLRAFFGIYIGELFDADLQSGQILWQSEKELSFIDALRN